MSIPKVSREPVVLAVLFLFCAVVLADEYAAANGDTDDNLGEQVDDGGAVANGRLGIRGAAIVTGNDHISNVIGRLQYIGDHKGACVAQEHTGDIALGEVVLTGHWIRSFLSENTGHRPSEKAASSMGRGSSCRKTAVLWPRNAKSHRVPASLMPEKSAI